MIKTAIVFDHKIPSSSKANHVGNIEIRVTIGRASKYIRTGVKCEMRNFVGGTILNRHDAKELNRRITIMYNRVLAVINDAMERGTEPTIEELRNAAYMVAELESKDSTALLDWIEEQEPMLPIVGGTRAHYRTLRTRMQEFGMTRWCDLTAENICKFDAWLRALKKPQSDAKKKLGKSVEGLKECTVYNYHKNLKAMLNRAVLFEKIQRNPYDSLRGNFKRGNIEHTEYLTDEEMQTLLSNRPTPGSLMAVVRDLFVFQMFTGLSFADMQTFDIANYRKQNGRWVAVAERIKTGVPYVSQLLPPVVDVLERYNFMLPRITLTKYNGALKTLGDCLGFTTKLHSHLARHTFATWMLRQGVKIENLSKMLGHTNITQTQRYAKVLAESVHNDFDKVAATFENEKGKAC